MVGRKTKVVKKLLTETELELMNIVWELKEATVNDVIDRAQRKLAYTSVSTILRILEQKKVLGSRKQGRGHIYFPKVEKTEYEKATLNNIVEKVFDGNPLTVVRQLLDTQEISKKDLNEIQELLSKRLD